jgi:VIT1/CCC1 family predicted Fe2+/Mn2+ transporter
MKNLVHRESHFTSSEIVRDAVIGLADGLTVPFALAAGLAGAVGSTAVIVIAGVAEIVAGSIAMGLGGYLAGRSDAEHYRSERRREEREIEEVPEEEEWEVEIILKEYGVSQEDAQPLIHALRRDHGKWTEFMMRFELGLEEPDPRRAIASAFTIAISYILGGIIPLSPYMFIPQVYGALVLSIVITIAALALFGAIKCRLTGSPVLSGTIKTVLIGAAAASAAYFVARLIA